MKLNIESSTMLFSRDRVIEMSTRFISLMVRLPDVDQHYEQVKRTNARILHPPETFPFGERQYTVEDLGGHRWTFTQSVADVAPEEWGGQLL